MTTRIKGYPFEVELADSSSSIVLADQVKSLDWRARNAEYKASATQDDLMQVRARLRMLIG